MTDFKNLAQLSSDALLVVAGGCITYANPAARVLMAPATGARDLQGLTAQALWQPNPLDAAWAWAGAGPLPPATVQLCAGDPHETGIRLELTATRAHSPEGPVYYVKASQAQAPGGGLAERVRTALALSTDAAMVVDARTLGFLDANPPACALMGMTLQAVRARGPATMRRRDGTGQEDFHALYAQLIERAPQALTHEYDFLADDGRTIPIAATRQALNVDGRWLIFITWRDISEQVAAQALVQQFKDAFDQAPDATNIIDVQTLSYVYVNEPFVRLMGLPRERILAGGPQSMPREIVVVDDLAAFLSSVVAHHPHTLVREKTVTLPDGRPATFESHHQAVFSGGRWLVRATRIDITQRKQQQHHLGLILAAFDASSDAIYIIDPQTFSYVDVNEAAARLHGVSRDELRAGGVRGAFPGRFDDAGLRARYDDLIARYPQALIEDRQIPRADGKVVWAESILRAISVDGEWRVISVMRDITERRAAHARLEQFKAAFDQTSDAVAIVDIDAMAYVYNNDANLRLLGISRAEMEHLTPPEVARRLGDTSDQNAHFAQLIAQYPEPITREISYRHKNGGVVHYNVRHQAMRSDNGWLAVSTKVDITPKKAAQVQLELLLTAIDAAPDAIAVVDPETFQYVHVNDAVCRLHAMTRSEVMASGMLGMFRHFTPETLRRRYDELVAMAPQAVSEERTVHRPDGSEIITEAVRRAVRVGDRWLVISVSRDVSERKAEQARLNMLRAAIDLAPDAFFLIDPQAMQYVDVNRAAGAIYGLSREQVLSLGLLGYVRHVGLYGHDEAPARLQEDYAAVIARYPQPQIQERSVRLPGRDVVYNENVRKAVPIDGRWLIVSVTRDITDRKREQARMERFAAVLNLSADAVLLVDRASMRIIDVNEAACRMHGYSRDELLALPPHMSRDGTTLEQLAADYDEAIAHAPAVLHAELDGRRADGSSFSAEVQRQALSQDDGGWIIAITVRDITERKLADAGLQQLKAVVDVAPDGMYIIDPHAQEYVMLNHAAGHLYGLSREEVLKMGMVRFMAWLGSFDNAFTPESIRERHFWLIDNYPQIHTSERLVRLPGRTDIVTETLRQAVQVDGQWLILVVVRDITERKRQQARMERFAAVVNLSADAVFVVDRKTLRAIDCNAAACHMYRRSREEILALAPNANRPGMDTAALEQLYDETIARSPGIHYMEHDAVRSDGSVFQAETHRLAIRSADSWLILATVRDITDRKRAESEIRQRVAELELLREAYDAAVDAILIADPETLDYYDVNQAAVKLLGVSREELLARGVQASYYSTSGEPFDAERFRKGSRYVISRAPEVLIEVRTVNPLGLGGRDTVIEFSRRAVHIDGRWVIVTLMRDITAAHRAEEEIRQRVAELTRSNQELEQFAYVTSHDLSEPLRMVASYTQLLSRRYADKFDDDGREFIKYAVDGAQRMKQLIDDLLMYSRAGRSKVPMRHIRLDRSLDDALANLAHAIERNGATIERTPLPELVCEKAGLTQVFQNLVGNAIKFRGEAAPVVRISAVEDENFWTISVADNGIGISSEYFQRIFVIFQRLHARTKYEGTGIGLSICKKIVERHGGQITVASEPGQGTTFSFTLSRSLTESESP